jgi:20S proteasome alpha/beta subunit
VTLLVGILCQDGVVMASDSAATMGATLGQQSFRKVHRLNEHMLFSGTGAVGIAQLISNKLLKMWNDKELNKGTPEAVMDRIGQSIGELVRPYHQSAGLARPIGGDPGPSLCKTLVALPVRESPQLFSFDYNGAPERVTLQVPFIAMGSGQSIADPFLAFLKRLLWDKSAPTMAEGKLVAVWTIDHVRRTNTGGVGGGIQLGLLQAKNGKVPEVEMLSDIDISEHEQRVGSAEKALIAELKDIRADPSLFGAPTADIPAPPLPA